MEDSAEKRIVDGVISAILEQRLQAGTKLGEPELCEIYGCSRTDVRRALVVLATRKTVELKRNRGAFVRVPSQHEARNVFQARRAIEKTLARNAALHATDADLAELEDAVRAEAAARTRGDRARAIGLSGEFHMVVARISGNDVLADFLRELIMRSSLIIGFFAGSNHVLPTGGSSRYDGGLSVQTFLRGIHVVQYDREALAGARQAATVLAAAEGLPSHGRAIDIRFDQDA